MLKRELLVGNEFYISYALTSAIKGLINTLQTTTLRELGNRYAFHQNRW